MANVLESPTRGFQEFGRAEGGSPTAGMTPVWIGSTDPALIFRGDTVIRSSNNTGTSGQYITAAINSTGGPVRGVFMGCEQYIPTAGRVVWSNYYNGVVTGSTGDVRAWVIDDPARLFLVQCSTINTVTSSYVGLNAGFTSSLSSLGNTTVGLSAQQLTSSLVGSTGGLPWRIVDFYSNYAPPGVPGIGTNAFINGTDNTTAANMVIVRLNNCERLNLTAPSSA